MGLGQLLAIPYQVPRTIRTIPGTIETTAVARFAESDRSKSLQEEQHEHLIASLLYRLYAFDLMCINSALLLSHVAPKPDAGCVMMNIIEGTTEFIYPR